MANYKKTRRNGRSKRQKRRSLKRNNRKSRTVMRGGVWFWKGLDKIPAEKPPVRYNVLVEYRSLRSLREGETPIIRSGIFDIYAYKDYRHLDGVLIIPKLLEYRKMNFTFELRDDGSMYITPERLLESPDRTQAITRIIIKSFPLSDLPATASL